MKNIKEGFQFMEENGLGLIAVLDCARLPKSAKRKMNDSGVPVTDYRRLLLIGHGGKCMWESLRISGMETADPVDHFTVSLTQRFIRDYLTDVPVLWLYPDSQYVVPLQQLGEAAGWCSPSPLGSGISPIYGVWYAYRAALLIDSDLPLVSEKPAPSPCASCVERPCISTCPAGAVKMEGFNIEFCADYRLGRHSPCADRCLARLACPIHPEHRYMPDQIQYHYHHSLATLRDWYDK